MTAVIVALNGYLLYLTLAPLRITAAWPLAE